MALVRLQNISVGFGGPALLDGVEMNLERGERVCLVGRNGEGKSTLLRIVNGSIVADSGEISRRQGIVISQLEQDVPASLTGNIQTIVMAALDRVGELLGEYHRAVDSGVIRNLDQLHSRIDALDGWNAKLRVETVLSRLQLDGAAEFETLSGGMKRRALLARALVSQPDILLLDEPTNHLDIDTIEWLEKFLREFKGTLLFITHDRAFLRRLATRILEIDRGRVTSWPGNYDKFLVDKQAALDAEQKQQSEFDKKLAREEVWIRQGIKARRTRNEGRVRDLEKMRVERAQRRNRVGVATINAQGSGKSGKIVLEAEGISCSIGGNKLVDDFSTTIMRGDRIGIIGPNGVGKTTLLNLLLGNLKPDAGQLKRGTNIELAYFDQMRARLDPDQTAQDNVGGGSEMIVVNGKTKHVISYMQDFLFSPQRARAPIKALSGGEKNRLMLAKLFARPSNLLVMDEPTNDLDIETLELLEEQILEYDGTLLLVSHDREFIDHIVTSTIVLDGGGSISEYVGGYNDWLRQRPVAGLSRENKTAAVEPTIKRTGKKLSYKDQRELDALPRKIEVLENEKVVLEMDMTRPDFYKQLPASISSMQERYKAVDLELEQMYERWEILEAG